MKIKTRLYIVLGLLFAMIAFISILAITHINKLSAEAKNILTDNYNTITYCRQMLIALNDDIRTPAAQNSFKENLGKQLMTITEVGEKELTEKVTVDFALVLAKPGDSVLMKNIRKDITDIMLLNMQAIQRKNKIAGETADNAIFWVAVAGTICFLIALNLLINLPASISSPIKKLTESIRQVAEKNYSQRLHFDSSSEFGELARSFNIMAQKLEEFSNTSMAKLLMEKQRIETLINNMSEPVIGLDAKKTILFMNDIALKITGLQKTEVIGKNIRRIAESNDLVKALVKDLDNEDPADKRAKTAPVKIYADDKESYFQQEIIPINIVPTGELEGKNIGEVILLQNITPFKELDYAKTNFIATVSHELKTPISSIKMSLQLLENTQIGNLNAEQQNLVLSIKDDANRLLKITGELLNMTQVESGVLQLNKTSVTTEQVFEYAIAATKAAADEKNIRLVNNIQPDLPSFIADREKISWVLTNFMSNAIRYSHENSSVHYSCRREDDRLLFSVTDSGQGIPQQYLTKVFERYFRIPGSRKEGTGLGLSISKEFIEAHGGGIMVQSELGVGSTFSFWLNAAISNG